MSIHKVTPFISEIKTFFNNKDLTGAMQTIAHIFSEIRMTDRGTLGIKDKCNTLYGSLAVFQCLILLPYLGVKNIFRTQASAASVLMEAQKDVFYRLLKNPTVAWRKALWSVSGQLWNKIRLRTDSVAEDVCLILDDTDFHKTGRTMENIGRVYSHLEHKCILGFKCLLMAVTDGMSQLVLDFPLSGSRVKMAVTASVTRKSKGGRILNVIPICTRKGRENTGCPRSNLPRDSSNAPSSTR